jgi:DNA repair exonuclease SbcCD ATPase subunit
MVQQVGRHTLQRILPETQAHMQRLLPRLTAGRYRQVKLDVGDQSTPSANFSIKLWDEEAGRYIAQDVFSSGTRDQCSLALRLALALALAPKGSGAMLGFIWLDEPLSSFDPQRARALVQILSQGPIAEQFDQVVLVSRSQSSNRDTFRFYVRLENGRMSESNLPQAPGTEQEVWQTGVTINREA